MAPSRKAAAPPPSASTGGETDSANPLGATPAETSTDRYELNWLTDHYNAGTAAIVDARPLENFVAGHIPGATHLPFEDFLSGKPKQLDYLPPDQPIIVYCDGGDCDASHKVKKMLHEFDFAEVYVFVPGYPAWRDAGLAVEQGTPETLP